MRNFCLMLSCFLSVSLLPVSSFADEQIQLAAAIGMPASTPPSGEDSGTTQPPQRSTGSPIDGSGPRLSTPAMIAIGAGVAVVIGVASGGSSSSTTSH